MRQQGLSGRRVCLPGQVLPVAVSLLDRDPLARSRVSIGQLRWISPPWAQVIDADFAVDCVLDWRAGDEGKLFVTLIDCRDGSEVWSGLYPVAEDDLQEVSSSVAGAVAASLASQVNHITLLRHARSTPAIRWPMTCG